METAVGYTCSLKDYNQPLNLLKMCYPLVHPSMQRRTSFRWLETLPNLNDAEFVNGYGATLYKRLNEDSKLEREFLKKHGILKNDKTFYCNVYQSSSVNSVEELGKLIGLIK
jgi:hypothetical protein